MAKATFVLVASFIRVRCRWSLRRLGAFCVTQSNIHKMDFYFLQIIRLRKRKRRKFNSIENSCANCLCIHCGIHSWLRAAERDFVTYFYSYFGCVHLLDCHCDLCIAIGVSATKNRERESESGLSFASFISSGFLGYIISMRDEKKKISNWQNSPNHIRLNKQHLRTESL